jgi:hypothetical protein
MPALLAYAIFRALSPLIIFMNTLAQLRSGQLQGIQRLDLACDLTEFPLEIYQLADTLEVLNLSGNALTSLPQDFSRLHQLRVLFCSENRFTHVPEVLGECPGLSMIGFKANQITELPPAALTPALRWLILTDNALRSLPAELGDCRQLQKLMLSGNQLQQLPEQMANCSALELLRIASNRFSSLPDWLLQLPKLAWLAYADNPVCDLAESIVLQRQAAQFKQIDWDNLSLHQELGQGASGVIHQATWRQQNSQTTSDPALEQQVAVKLFKSAVTSDGLPECEMAACMSAGSHPNLIGVAGQIAGHPERSAGLVMQLIDPSYQNLAGPPSLASCTRDVYANDSQFTLETALRIATGIAAAVSHLHARGILHGDLYGHNILRNPQGDSLLGDFGAASFFAPDDVVNAQALQRLEVRAFACLLEELLDRCEHLPTQQDCLLSLRALQARCALEDYQQRPLFAEIALALSDLRA